MTEAVIAKQRRRPVKQKPSRFTHLQAVICKPDQLSQIMRWEMLLVIDALSKTSKKILNHPYSTSHFASYSQGKKTNPNAISPGKVREAPETAAEEERGGNLNLNNPPTFH